MKNRYFLPFLSFGMALMFTMAPVSAAPILRENSHGHDVFILQKMLQKSGYGIKSLTGIFGDETKTAVRLFQKEQKLPVTGVVDGETWRRLQKNPARPTKLSPEETILPPSFQLPSAPVPESRPFLRGTQVPIVISTAKKYIGTPYAFGGTTPKAFDCSGYLQYIFAENGITLPRTADEQFKLGEMTMTPKQLVPGDLVFFTTYAPGASHCGLYLGNGKFIHTSASKGVRIDELDDSYWKPRYYGGKHIVQ